MSPWHPFSRSYGVILPSSLTILLPPALGFSPHPPVSVYGTGTVRTIAAFLGACPSLSPTSVRSSFGAAFRIRFFLDAGLSNLPRVPFRVVPHIRVPTVLSYRSTGISTCRPSTTALALALGPDLPRADQLDSGNLGYSACFLCVHCPFRYSFLRTAMLLYRSLLWQRSQSFGGVFSPVYFRRGPSRLVSYYALFECVAASEPTS